MNFQFLRFLIFLSLTSLIGCGLNTRPSSTRITSVDELDDKIIAVTVGSFQEKFAFEHYPKAKIDSYNAYSDCAAAVLAGKADVALCNNLVTMELLRTRPELGCFEEPLYHFEAAPFFRKGDDTLRNQFNTFLKQLRDDGLYDEIVERWLTGNAENVEMPKIENPENRGTIVIGADFSMGAPRHFYDKNHRPTGFDTELSLRFGAYLGKKVKFEDVPLSSVIASVQSGKIDFDMSGLFMTEERGKHVDFGEPYYFGTLLAVLRKDRTGGQAISPIKTVDDLSGKSVAVSIGGLQEIYAEKHFPPSQIKVYNLQADCIAAVSTGNADFCLLQDAIAMELAKTKPEMTYVKLPVFDTPYGAAFRKESDGTLLRRFDEFLDKIKSDGTHREMTDRWYTGNIENAVIPPIENTGTNGTLTIGADFSVGAPLVFYDENQRPCGFDMELAFRFAAYLGKQPKIEDISFGAFIPSLESGKVDVILSVMTITEERAKKVDFSKPYYTGAVYPVFRKHEFENGSRSGGIVGWFSDGVQANLVRDGRYRLILEGLLTTLAISIGAMLIGTGVGAGICAMMLSRSRIFRAAAKTYITLLWGIPSLVLLMFFYYVFFASIEIGAAFVATIAFGLNIGAHVAEIMYAGIRSVDPGQIEAGKAMGMTSLQTFRWITFPQATGLVWPMYQAAFTTLLRGTSVVGYIAIRDLTKAGDLIRSRTFDAVFPLLLVAVLYLVMSYLTSFVFSFINKRQRR